MATEAPFLESKAVHGIAEPEEFTYPAKHPLWSPMCYESFQIHKNVDNKQQKTVCVINFVLLSLNTWTRHEHVAQRASSFAYKERKIILHKIV